MHIAAKRMYGTSLVESDGRGGTLYDLLFDDQTWKLRHLVVAMDRWLLSQQVLLDPAVVQRVDWPNRRLEVRLTKEQVRRSPGVETDLPAARQEVQQVAQVLLWEAYWTSILETLPKFEGDPHLRSTKMLAGLRLHCTNGELGHVVDFLIDDQSWSVCDLVVDTRNWWPGKRVLIEPRLVQSIDWDEREIRLSLPREQVEDRPAYQHETPSDEPLVGQT
jgi:hypothetical protein